MKTLNTQLGSWTQLRHDTVLYVKQSATGPIGCEYPRGFVEPRPEFFHEMKAMAEQASSVLQGVPSVPGPYALPSPSVFFTNFATTCAMLESIAAKELAQHPLATNEVSFLENTIERTQNYFGVRQYSGWYPALFYWGRYGDGYRYLSEYGPGHDAGIGGVLVSDVHTDGPSDPDHDPGAILHEAIDRANLLMIAVDNGPDRMVFAGPVFSHYEFLEPYGSRLTDEEWTSRVKSGTAPAPPPWTQSYLVRKPTP
jgi:hypothetical protein